MANFTDKPSRALPIRAGRSRTAVAISAFFSFLPRRTLPNIRSMEKNRLEAFSDGVFAIIITIMVLEMKVPHGSDINVLEPLLPVFLTYILSFVYVGIYWNNHHHLLKAAGPISGGILWANLHL